MSFINMQSFTVAVCTLLVATSSFAQSQDESQNISILNVLDDNLNSTGRLSNTDIDNIIKLANSDQSSPVRNYQKVIETNKNKERGIKIKGSIYMSVPMFDENKDGYLDNNEMDDLIASFNLLANNSKYTKEINDIAAVMPELNSYEQNKAKQRMNSLKISNLLSMYDH